MAKRATAKSKPGEKKPQRVDEALAWACETLGAGIDAKQGDAPSGIAWFIYAEMRDNPVMRGKGFDMLGKLMPTRAQLDDETERKCDDGREVLGLVARLIKQCVASGEGVTGEAEAGD